MEGIIKPKIKNPRRDQRQAPYKPTSLELWPALIVWYRT